MNNDVFISSICVGVVGCGAYFLNDYPFMKIVAGILTLLTLYTLINNFIENKRGTDAPSRIIKNANENTDKILSEIKVINTEIKVINTEIKNTNLEIKDLIKVLADKK